MDFKNGTNIGRRDFLRYSATASGLLVAERALGQVRPCPPKLTVEGPPPSSNGDCSTNAEADWQSRISGPGVVWYHDFRDAAEVNNFRWVQGYGTDPGGLGSTANRITRVTTDGITGACMQIQLPTSGSLDAQWWRPFSPLRAGGNGRATDDPAANGTISAKTWSPPQNGTVYTAQWVGGNYAHADYAGSQEAKDGTDFWIQLRVKLDPGFMGTPAGNLGGKILYLSRVEQSLTAQEIVPYLLGQGHPQPFQLYYGGSPSLAWNDPNSTWPLQGDWQPGSDYGFCQYPNNSNPSTCWLYSYDTWQTWLIHIIPGHENDDHTTDHNDTGIEVWMANEGQTSYTKIWERYNYNFDFSNAHGQFNGWNAIILSNWHNSWNGGTPLWIRFAQLIFSKQFIPCPQV